jgi:hypothetical protein
MLKSERINKNNITRIGLARRAPYIVTSGAAQYLGGKDSFALFRMLNVNGVEAVA